MYKRRITISTNVWKALKHFRFRYIYISGPFTVFLHSLPSPLCSLVSFVFYFSSGISSKSLSIVLQKRKNTEKKGKKKKENISADGS